MKWMKFIFSNKVAKFGAGGVLNFILKLGITILLTEIVQIWYFAAYIISLVFVILFSFFYNAYITFNVKDNKLRNLVKYSFALVTLSLVDAISVRILTELVDIYYIT